MQETIISVGILAFISSHDLHMVLSSSSQLFLEKRKLW